MRYSFLAVLLAAALAAPAWAQPAPDEANPANLIAEPVWETPPPSPAARPPMYAIADFRENIALQCTVSGGALTECAATDPGPESFVSAAIRAAGLARIAPQDAGGAPTEGRPVRFTIGFGSPPSVFTNALTWVERPTGEDYTHFYPARALAQNVQGSAVLDCVVNANGSLACAVFSEEPDGWGFGAASLNVARSFRAAQQTSDGRSTRGARVRLPINWRLAG